MVDEKKFLVDVGMNDLPFPIKVLSRDNPDGQATIATISISARIMDEFAARWIDTFIKIVHAHRDRIGTKTLKHNIKDYVTELRSSSVEVNFDFPFFIEKVTPVSKEKCLVRYLCTYSAKAHSVKDDAKSILKMEIPCITTYPGSDPEKTGGLFGQLSTVIVEVESEEDVYPEDIVEIVDKYALSPVYSFLTQEDQLFLIQKIHSEEKTSVAMVDEIKDELAHDGNISWYSVRVSNYGMLHSYNTVISTKKSMWIPCSDYSG